MKGEVVKMVKMILSFFSWDIKYKNNKDKEQLYIMFGQCWSKVCITVHQKDVLALERVKRSIRRLPRMEQFSYEERLNRLIYFIEGEKDGEWGQPHLDVQIMKGTIGCLMRNVTLYQRVKTYLKGQGRFIVQNGG